MSGNVVFASVAAGIFVATAYAVSHPATVDHAQTAVMLGLAAMTILFAIKSP